jgi:hypothetical protein
MRLKRELMTEEGEWWEPFSTKAEVTLRRGSGFTAIHVSPASVAQCKL